MGTNGIAFVAGCLAGVLATLLVHVLTAQKDPGERTESQREATRLAEIAEERDRLRERLEAATDANKELSANVEELEQELVEARAQARKAHEDDACGDKGDKKGTEVVTEITDEEIEKELGAFGQKLQAMFMGRGEHAVERLQAFLKRGGKKVIDRLIEQWKDDETGLERKVVLAHALAQSGDPEAIESLQSVLRDPDAGFMDHRIAAHGLAFSEAEGIEPFLTQVARNNKDTGVRANASFGLARRGIDEGFALYAQATDQAFENKDSLATQYLTGFYLLGDKILPYMRERLLSYKDPQAVVVLIEIAKAKEDKGAIPALEKLAYDASQPKSVQTAAQAALKALKESAEGADKE